jgi:hypothetical protein
MTSPSTSMLTFLRISSRMAQSFTSGPRLLLLLTQALQKSLSPAKFKLEILRALKLLSTREQLRWKRALSQAKSIQKLTLLISFLALLSRRKMIQTSMPSETQTLASRTRCRAVLLS